MSYSEDILVEQPAIALFAELGWQMESALEEVFGAGGTLGRETPSEVVLAPRLRAAVPSSGRQAGNDEADRILDMGFIEDVERIAAATPAGRQSLLFGATLEGGILRVAQRLLQDPVRVQIASIKERHTLIEQRMHRFDDTKHGTDHNHST